MVPLRLGAIELNFSRISILPMTNITIYIPLQSQLWRAGNTLKNTLDPLHSKFFDRVNQLPGGMKFLIDMRADLLVCSQTWMFQNCRANH